MPRKAQGTTFVSDGAIYASVTIAPRKRHARALSWLATTDELPARAWASLLQELVDAIRAAGRGAEAVEKIDVAVGVGRDDPAQGFERVRASVAKLRATSAAERIVDVARPAAKGELTFARFAARWTSGELHGSFPDHVRPKKSANHDVARLEKYINPVIGTLPLSEVSLDHAQEILRRIPRDAAPATRRHVAQILAKVLSLAVYPCRLLAVSPLPRGFLPRVGKGKAFPYVYPDEDRALLACADVPVANRMLYGFLAREGMRTSEAFGMTWADVDVERGAVRLDRNKTDDPRAWALSPGVVAALAWWRTQVPHAPDDAVFVVADPGHLAADFRGHLQTAGVVRRELFERSGARMQIRAHDLRATFVTTSLANGRTEAWIADRTGHRSSFMINRYRRAARTVAELGLGDLAPLDVALPEVRSAREAQGTPAETSPGRAAKRPTTNRK